jgi:hypothetical protein
MAWPGARKGTLAAIAAAKNVLVVRRTFIVSLLANALDAQVDAVGAFCIS